MRSQPCWRIPAAGLHSRRLLPQFAGFSAPARTPMTAWITRAALSACLSMPSTNDFVDLKHADRHAGRVCASDGIAGRRNHPPRPACQVRPAAATRAGWACHVGHQRGFGYSSSRMRDGSAPVRAQDGGKIVRSDVLHSNCRAETLIDHIGCVGSQQACSRTRFQPGSPRGIPMRRC